MNAHELANKLTEKEVENVIAYWEQENSHKLDEMKSLVRLGDSKALAVATVMTAKDRDSEIYRIAYYS